MMAYWSKTAAHNFPKAFRYWQGFGRQKALAGYVISVDLKNKIKKNLQLNKAELRVCDLTSREVTVYISVKVIGR